MTESRPVGASMLALLALLVGLLGGFAALALILTVLKGAASDGLVARSLAMLLLCAGYLLLATGFWRVRPWVRRVCHGVFLVLLAASLLSTAGSGIIELGAVLVLGLGFLVNTASLIYLRMPGAAAHFRQGNDPG